MKRHFSWHHSATAAAVSAALFLLAGVQSSWAGRQTIPGHVPAVVARLGLKPVGHYDATNRIRLAIGLPLRDQAGLSNLLSQLYDPASPNFHQYLTAAAFAERFGPAPGDYQTLVGFARSNNLTLLSTHPNRVLLDVEGSVTDIEKAFNVKMQVYQHPTEARQFFAPDSEPSVDLNLPILHISGMDNYFQPRPLCHLQRPAGRSAAPNGAPLTGSGPGGAFFGYDFRNAYAPGVTLTGTGQVCGLLELDGYYTSDIISYETQAGLPNVPLVNIPIDGGIVGQPGGGVGEVSLDIEMVIAMAPGISSLFVYEAPNPSPVDDMLNRMASDNVAKQISSSWIFQPDATTDQIFMQMATEGISFYQASGDSDAYVGPIDPSEEDAYITEVGGTTLTMSGSGQSYSSEKVWNWGYQPPGGAPQFNNYWGSGGGVSTDVPIPSWQQGVSMTNNGGSTAFRNTPDVALTADNIWVFAGNQTQDGAYGGTSCAAPLWCGFTALVNQQGAVNGDPTQGFINPAIYAIGKSANYNSCFHDVVLGDNTWSNSPNEFLAVKGYDLATGWGTPVGSNLINALAPVSTIPVLRVVTNIVSGGNGNGVVDYDECDNLIIVLTNAGTALASGISATLSSTTYGAIVGQSTSSYPQIQPGGNAANLNSFTLSTISSFVCGTPINLTMVIKSDQGSETNFITLPTGSIGTPVSFTNATSYAISNATPVPLDSPVFVSGLQAVGKVTVSVYLPALDDGGLTLSLISPNNTSVTLSQNNGFNFGNGGGFGTACAQGSETVFDDAAPTPITAGVPPFVGSFAPQQPLSVFNLTSGTNLNGVWNLQVVDSFPGDTAFLGCWSLNISPEICQDGGGQCPGADLGLGMTAAPAQVFISSNVVYTITVTNSGPGPANNAIITETLPTNLSLVSVTGYSTSAALAGTNLTIALGTLPVYSSITETVTAVANAAGYVTSTATVASQTADGNPNNNAGSATVLVTQPTADAAVTMTGTPSAVLQNAQLTYTINVTNNGPFTAKGVTLTTTLPTNANFISATASQGSVTLNGSLASLGDIPKGTNVVVKIIVSPTVTGNITASTVVSISSTEVDPNVLNNTAYVNTTVGPAADLAISAVAVPSPVVGGSNVTYIATITNLGPSTETSITFSQTIPAGGTFVSCSLPGSALNNNIVSGPIASLAVGSSIMVTDVITSPTLLAGVQSQPLITTLSVFGQPGDPNTNNNVVTLTTFAEPPVITIVPAGVNILSGSSNGSIGTNGRYTVQFLLQNAGTVPTTNLVATLLSTNGVTLPSSPQTYGVLAAGGAAVAEQFSFTSKGTNGGTNFAVLQLQDGASNLGYVTNTFVMPVVTSFWNTGIINIPALGSPDDIGPASPYPSAITVSNITGDVGAVTVTVSNLYHTYPNDIGLLLVGPTGASCVLMSSVANFTQMTAPATITFDESSPLILLSNASIVSGTYQPADYYSQEYSGKTETFSNSAVPVGPYNTNLSIFGTISPNGTWRLYGEDNGEGDAGAISNGWGISITTITPVTQVADLAVSLTASTNQVVLGNNVTYNWTVTNNGPSTTVVFVTNILSAGLSYVTNVMPFGVSLVQSGATNIFNVGSLAPGAGLTISSVVSTSAASPQTNTISAGSALIDGNPGNNTATAVLTVNPTPADLAVGPISTPANSVVVNGNLVYTLVVTNNGPSNALSVVGWFTNTAAMQLVSAVPSQGFCVTNGSYVQCVLGTIPAGSIAVVTVTATPTSIGSVTNYWHVTTSCNDTNLTNNSTSTVITVTQPIAIITNAPAVLISQASAPFNGAINSGQTNTVSFVLTNIGSGPTTNLVATLLTNSGLRPVTASNVYGAIAAGGAASNSFTFVGTGSPGAIVTATLSLRDGSNTNLGTVAYNFMLPVTKSYTNGAAIVIPDVGPASPYPSSIPVSGLTNGASDLVVSQVTASLNGFAHSFPHDVEAVLVSPSGDELVLMEHAGGPYAVSNLVFNFTDAATQVLSSNQLASGTYLATEYPPFDVFPGLQPIPTASTNLGFLNGSDANGAWSLYVYDDSSGNNGIIANGWTLGLTAISPVNPPARLLVTSEEAPDPAVGGNYVTYQITVQNLGPGVANNVVLTDVTPAGTALTQSPVSQTQGTYSTAGGTVTCNLGPIPAGGSAIVVIQVIVTANSGTLVNTASATTASADLYLPDATSTTKTPVSGTQAAVLSATNLNGSVQLTVEGYLGQSYAVQISSNLLNWTTVSTNTGVFKIIDNSTNAPVRFYRAVQIPQ